MANGLALLAVVVRWFSCGELHVMVFPGRTPAVALPGKARQGLRLYPESCWSSVFNLPYYGPAHLIIGCIEQVNVLEFAIVSNCHVS